MPKLASIDPFCRSIIPNFFAGLDSNVYYESKFIKQFKLLPSDTLFCLKHITFENVAAKPEIAPKPITRWQILDWSKLKQSADDNFKFDENIRKFSKWVENTVGKGEIARYEQFLLFPQRFQKACFPGASKGVIVWEWVKSKFFLCYNIYSCIRQQFIWSSIL